MKLSFQKRLTLSFLIIFTLFTIGIVVFEQSRERRYKTEAMEEKLDAYADIVNAYLVMSDDPSETGGVMGLLPSNMRLTVINSKGGVVYDNLFTDPSGLENHSGREEVAEARKYGRGSDVRTSVSNNQPYLYYAKYYGNGFVRVALPYDIEVEHFLQPDNGFLYFIIALFILGFIFIQRLSDYFGSSIRRLRDFAAGVSNGNGEAEADRFPGDELGEISRRIASNYARIRENKAQLSAEREKLLLHVQSSAEGVCFFNPDGSVAFYNGLFLQYFNIISNGSERVEGILDLEIMAHAKAFILSDSHENYFEMAVRAQGKEFLLRLNRFEDRSFEIALNDITKQEKTKQLKREMTGNISHELRTPVTSIRGYLETLLDAPLPPEQQRKFIEKAYNQTLALSDLIRDVGLLTRIDETPSSFDNQPIDLNRILDRLETEMASELKANGTAVERHIPAGLSVYGNEGLVYSIFRNLTDNVVRYAGKGAGIIVREMPAGGGMVGLSFADTGKGVDNEGHLERIFERFYRADEGRTRNVGGSGLGLSIVKNAVAFHGGSIAVRNRKDGGLEFIFYLPEGR